MSVASAQYYWLTCDAPGCEARCPDEMDEYSAWQDAETARMVAVDSEWKCVTTGDFCEEHAMNVCERCEKYDPTPLAGERDYLCVEHAGASV